MGRGKNGDLGILHWGPFVKWQTFTPQCKCPIGSGKVAALSATHHSTESRWDSLLERQKDEDEDEEEEEENDSSPQGVVAWWWQWSVKRRSCVPPASRPPVVETLLGNINLIQTKWRSRNPGFLPLAKIQINGRKHSSSCCSHMHYKRMQTHAGAHPLTGNDASRWQFISLTLLYID